MPLASQAQSRGIGIYHLNIGQPDLPTPEPILERIRSFPDSIVPYAPSQGYPQTLAAWSQYYGSHGYDVQPRHILVTTGGSEALWLAFMAVGDPDDEIILFEPTYANYFGFATGTGVQAVPITLSGEDGFHLPEAAEIESFITARTKAICIANPNNPTGTVYDRSELEMLLDLAVRHALFVISDETYRELVFDGLTHTSMLQFGPREVDEHVIVVDSVSKRFSATGTRVGCIVSRNAEVMDAVGRFAQARLSSATVEQLAVIPMLSQPVEYTTWLRAVYERRRNVVYDQLQDMNIVCQKPSGAFYILVDLPIDDADRFAAWLLTDFQSNGETVMVAPGTGFYLTPGCGTRQARIAFVLDEAKLTRALKILGEALLAYPGGQA